MLGINNIMSMKRNLILFIKLLVLLLSISVHESCTDSNERKLSDNKYNPSIPVQLTTFYPDSGGIADKVIISGSNFGVDTENIRVYFNRKQAAVISSDGERIFTIVPRMPGDDCTISVVVENDSSTFENTFQYHLSVSVSTVVGNGSPDFISGTLSESEMKPHFIGVDNENNIFVSIRDGSTYGIA